MTQDSLTTKPIGSDTGVDNEGGEDQPRGRRRLGGWQLATGDLSGDELAPAVTGDLATAAIDTETLLSTELGTASIVPQTTPFLASLAARLSPTAKRGESSELGPGSSGPTLELNDPSDLARTAIIPSGRIDRSAKPEKSSDNERLIPTATEHHTPDASGLAARTESDSIGVATRTVAAKETSVEATTKPISQDTVLLLNETAPIAAQTRRIETAIAPIRATAEGTAVIAPATTQIASTDLEDGTSPSTPGTPGTAGPGDTASGAAKAEIERLNARVAAEPGDSDALFELAVLLHRSGLRTEARNALGRLVTLYEERGQHQQAARIKGMLAAPKTGPIATQELEGQNIGLAAGRTAPLRDVTSLIGRARNEKKPAKTRANIHAFPPESMLFTIPLPAQEDLEADVVDILGACDEELTQGQFAAALDSCIQVIGLAPDYKPIYLRLAEIYTRQRLTRRARAQAEALVRLADATGERDDLWMVYRVILHASGGDTASLKRLVELLIDAGRTEQASIYASRLIQILDAEGLDQEALTYSIRLCDLIPGDTRAALENAILRLKTGDRGGALDRWESAVAQGADPIVAKASIAALTTTINEDDHWRMLADVIPVLRGHRDPTIVDAYVRTAVMLPESPTLQAGQGLLLLAAGNTDGKQLLMQAAGARNGPPMSRASAAVALSAVVSKDGNVDEYVAAVRTALKLLQDPHVAAHSAWPGLVGHVPRFEDLSLELGDVLLTRGDAAGAADVLKEGHARSRHHGPMCEKLAEAYFKIGQLGSALTVLDELAVHYRSAGQLESMAGVLRQMSQLAPNNIKVKSRLIDAYLQRGFVAEARAELVQRADLEERSGLIKDAVASLQRAADLSWTIGLADETFALYSRVIEMAPDDVGNRSALVNFYLQMGRLSEAAEHQRAVVDIALRNNHRHEAIAALHQVIGLTPDDTTAYYQLADLLASMGEYRQAEKVYRRLVLMNPGDAIAQAKATSMASLRES